jgi:hypothetical protein
MALWLTQPSFQWVPEVISVQENLSRREADHLSQSSAEIKNGWSYDSTLLYVFMARCLETLPSISNSVWVIPNRPQCGESSGILRESGKEFKSHEKKIYEILYCDMITWSVARQRLNKQVSQQQIYVHASIKQLLEPMFYRRSMPRLYNEDRSQLAVSWE